MRIGLDIDGVLADFNRAYAIQLRDVTGRDLIPPGYNFDAVPVWDWEKALGYTNEEVSEVWKVIKTHSNFWVRLGSLPGARHLKQLDSDSTNEIYYITSRPGYTSKIQTELWLKARGVMNPTVLISSNKGPIAAGLGLDVFIDDKPENISDVIKHSSARCYLLDYPYNRHASFVRVNSLTEALVQENLIAA